MPKPRYVLRYRGEGTPPEEDVARVHAHSGVSVVDSSARMLVVESDPEALQDLADALPDWLAAPDEAYVVPDTRKKAERPPE